MNWLDRSIAAVAPTAGVKRAQARLALEQVRLYEAAKRTRRTENWRAGSGSANREIIPSIATVRARCRQTIRDNEYASRGLDALVARTVGTGIVATAPEQKLWDRWTQYCDVEEQLDFAGMIELAHRTRREVGESLLWFKPQEPDGRYEVPLLLQVLEPDHLDEFRTGEITETGNIIIAGVEFDRYTGARAAYWIYPIHPGEVASWRQNSLRSVRVPADEMIHYYRKRRPSQVRGMPELATALLRLRDLGDYEVAELVRKKIEACFVAFVSSDDDQAQLGTTDPAASPRQEKLTPGMVKYLKNSESVTFGSPAPSGGYGEYTLQQLYAVAAGAGCTLEMLTGNYSQLSFSGGRLSELSMRPLIEAEQWLALVPGVLNRVASRFQLAARLAGKQRVLAKPFGWTMPRVQIQDLLKEAQGIRQLVLSGLISLPEAIRELGYDPMKVADENHDYYGELARKGLVVDSNAATAIAIASAKSASQGRGDEPGPGDEPATGADDEPPPTAAKQ